MRARVAAPVAAISVLLLLASEPAVAATPRWIRRIDRIVGGHPMSVMVGNDGRAWYRHDAAVRRAPASNEKLMLSMALFDHFHAGHTFKLRALATGSTPTARSTATSTCAGRATPRWPRGACGTSRAPSRTPA